MKSPKVLISALLVLLIIGGAVAVAYILDKTGPKAVKSPPEKELTTVEVIVAKKESYDLLLDSRGEVMAAQQSRLSAEVGGLVEGLSEKFVVGGIFQKGETLVQISKSDYRAALAEAKSRESQADVTYRSELSRASQAERDWKKLGGNRKPDPLVLRKPQLAAAKSQLEAATAAVAKAKRDLKRTTIKAPYDCRVMSRSVDVGALAAPGAAIAEIESLSDLEVRLPLTLEDYGYLSRKGGNLVGVQVNLRGSLGGRDVFWKASLVRSEGAVDRATRSIHVVAKISPNAGEFSLPPTGLFVEAEIDAQSLSNVVVVPRRAFVGQSQVLLLNEKSEITFRDVTVLRREADVILVGEGLKLGERVVVTSIESPIAGQKVKEKDSADEKKSADEQPTPEATK